MSCLLPRIKAHCQLAEAQGAQFAESVISIEFAGEFAMVCMRHFVVTVVFSLVAGSTAPAQMIYSFEPPNFVVDQFTPFNNISPNIGPVGFQTTFTSSPNSNGFKISPFVAIGGLFSGQSLVAPMSPDTLILSFNQPVSTLSVAFALITPGYLRLLDGATISDQPSMVFPGNLSEGGTLIYNNPAGFSSVSLTAFTSANGPNVFVIDNLNLTAVVPEPNSILLCGVAISVGWQALRRRQSKTL